MSITPHKAKFERKNGFISATNSGFIIFEFMPLFRNRPKFKNLSESSDSAESNSGFVKWNERHSFVCSANKSIELLSIDPINRKPVSLEFNYANLQSPRKLSFTSQWDYNRVKVTLDYHTANGHVMFSNHLHVNDIMLIQKMIEYSTPSMQGWNAIEVEPDVIY